MNNEEIELLEDKPKIDEKILDEANNLLYEYKNLMWDTVIFSQYFGTLYDENSKWREACKTQMDGMYQYREGLEQRIFLMMTGQKD